ncbi:flagellar export protein FliJ [Aliikangiella sp. IMCC44653]
MVRSKRLQPINRLAQKGEKAAAIEYAQLLENQRNEALKLHQLETYKTEYLKQMEVRVKQGVSGATLQHYHQFLAKISEAIKQQEQVILAAENDLHEGKSRWHDKRTHAKAIDQLVGKLSKEERSEREKKENKQIDEMSTQAFLRRQYQL